MAYWLTNRRSAFAKPSRTASASFSWRKEVWPFQWKIGVSAFCGSLIFQAFNPIVLLEQGPVVAGQFGMSLSLVNMLLMVTTAWPVSQAARYGGLIRRERFDELRHAFWSMCIASTLVAVLATLAMYLALMWATDLQIRYVDRFADPLTTGILLATAILHHVTQCFSVVLRAERRDPTLAFTVVGSAVLVVAVWICARYGMPREIALANFALIVPSVPIVIYMYWKRNAHWLRVSSTEFDDRRYGQVHL